MKVYIVIIIYKYDHHYKLKKSYKAINASIKTNSQLFNYQMNIMDFLAFH